MTVLTIQVAGEEGKRIRRTTVGFSGYTPCHTPSPSLLSVIFSAAGSVERMGFMRSRQSRTGLERNKDIFG
jgi:hypothetical protein